MARLNADKTSLKEAQQTKRDGRFFSYKKKTNIPKNLNDVRNGPKYLDQAI